MVPEFSGSSDMSGTKIILGLLGFVALLAILVLGRPLLAPLVFTFLVWALVNAVADWLQRMRLPRWLAWFGALALLVAGLYFIVLIISSEAGQFTAEAPAYGTKLQQILARVLTPLHLRLNFTDLLSRFNFAAVLTGAAASVGSSAFAIVQVFIYLGFLLAEQSLFSAKYETLETDFARRQAGLFVLQKISGQLQSFLAVYTVLSAIIGIAAYVLLAILGVPFAAFMALIIFVLGYIPTIGAIAIVLPALVALVQFGSFGLPLLIVAALGVLHFVLMDIISTKWLGSSLNLSPFIIIVALSFWGLIWGVAGLFLAVPLTAAIAIACAHVERLRWISILLAAPRTRKGELQVAT